MLLKARTIKRKTRSLLLRVLNRIENNGDADFERNGERFFISQLLRLLRTNVRPPYVIFDIGANCGEYSQMLLTDARAHGSRLDLHAFEPTRSCATQLRTRFEGASEVRVVEKAASSRGGATRIFFDKPGSALASLYERNLKQYKIEFGLSEEVGAIRLDDYIESEGVEHIHFLKLDIEGHEISALEGMGKYLRPEFVDFIQFEYGGANLDAGSTLMQLFMLFESTGFSVTKVMPRGLELRNYEPWMENYQYGNYVAISKLVPYLS